MKSIMKKTLGLLMILCMVLFAFSFVKVNVNADASETVVILDGRATGLTSTATIEDTEITENGFTYVVSAGAKSQNTSACTNSFCEKDKDNYYCSILIGKLDTYIYNTTPFGAGITKFEIYANKGASAKVSVGVYFSANPIGAYQTGANTYTATLSTLDSVYDCTSKIPTGAKYFWYQVTNANNSQVQFRITYSTDASKPVVTFDANGGIGSMDNQLVTASTDAALDANNYTRLGYSFAGWATSANGDVVYADGANINVDSDITLYAKWNFDSENYAKVIFHDNKQVPGNPVEQIVLKNTNANLNSNTFDNGSLGFIKWNTVANGSGTDYAAGAEINISSNLELYAQWGNWSIAGVLLDASKNKEFAICGEIVAIISASQAIIQDSTGAILLYGSDFPFVVGNTVSLTGTYDTYVTDVELKNLANINISDVNDTVIDTLPLDVKNQVVIGNQYQYIELDNLYISNVVDKTATIDGESFVLYYKNAERVEDVELLVADSYVNVTGVVYYYQESAQICITSVATPQQYTISYNSNGGIAVASQTVLKDVKFDQPANPSKAKDEDYTYEFGGWYTDNNTFNNEFDFDVASNADVVVYAKWIQHKIPAHEFFVALNTLSSLRFGYEKQLGLGEETQATLEYVGGVTSNMVDGNNAATVGLNPTIFNVVSTKINDGQNHVGLNSANHIRMYKTSTLDIECQGQISSVVITYTSSTYVKGTILNVDGYKYNTNDNPKITGTSNVYTYTLPNVTHFQLANNTDTNRISSIVITYKTADTTYTINSDVNGNDLSMMFVGNISASLKAKLDAEGSSVKYGVLYGLAKDIKDDFDSLDDLVSTYLNGGQTLEEVQASYSGLKAVVKNANELQGVNEKGNEAVNENPEYYQFGVSINHISMEKLGTKIEAAAFVCIDGTYYIMNEKKLSVSDLAQVYLDADNTESYERHLGALEWLTK